MQSIFIRVWTTCRRTPKVVLALVMIAMFSTPALLEAQANNEMRTTIALPDAPKPKLDFQEHHFYDIPGKILFGTALTVAAFDTAQTCHNLATGGHEDWLSTRHCSQATLIIMGQVAAQESLAWVLHRTHHHKLERLIRFFTIEEDTRGIIYSKEHGAW